jgi:uncharacterized YigZ family protein
MLFDDTYRTIAANSRLIYKEKNSKFISLAIPVKTEIEVNEHLRVIKKEFYDANHHCYAFRLGSDKNIYRFNDDGEPSGTAGKPIFGQILSFDLTNLLIVVVRYFGGTKLGVSGLINAYKTAARNLLTDSIIITKTIDETYNIVFDYKNMNSVMKILKDNDIKPLDSNFENICYVRISVRKTLTEKLKSKLSNIRGLTISLVQEF